MKRSSKIVLGGILALLAVLVILVIIRANGKVVVTNKPEVELNALIMATMGVSDRNAAAWDAFQAVIAEPKDEQERSAQVAGGRAAVPKDWPEGGTWPFDFGDALRPNLPEVIKNAAAAGLATLRANGYFDRLRQVRLGDTPVLLVNTDQASMFEFLLPEFGKVRTAARLNAYRMRHALNDGDEQEFLEAVRDNRFFARVVSQEFLIGALVGYAIDAMTLTQIRLALMEHRLSPETLRSLDEIVRTCDPRSVMKFAVKAERIGQQDMIQRLFTDDGKGNGHIAPRPRMNPALGLTPGGTPTGIVATLASFVIADRKENEAALDAFRDAGLACLAKSDAAGADLAFTALLDKYPKFQYPYLYILAPALGKAVATAITVESDVHATRLLIAIELYKHANGAAPATLDALVPAFFPSIPPDSISGKPWVYKVLPAPDEHGRRFLLYSVGTDGVDNAGTHAIEAKFRSAGSVGKDFVYNSPRE